MEASRTSRSHEPQGLADTVRHVGHRVGHRLGVWLLAAGLLIGAVLILAAGLMDAVHPLELSGLAAPLVAVLYFFAERFPVHLRVRRETHTFSLTEIPLLIGLFFLPPLAVVLAQTLGAGVALIVYRRCSPTRLALNLANFGFSTTSAAWVFHLLLPAGDPLGPMALVAAYAAGVTADQLSGLGVALAIWLSGGERPEFHEHVGLGITYTLVDTSLAVVAVIVAASRPEALWLLAIPLVTTLVGFRLYQEERLKRESLISLQESTRDLQEVFDSDDMTPVLLRQVRDMFGVRMSALLVLEGGDLPAGVTTLDLDDALTRATAAQFGGDDVLAALTGSTSCLVVRRPVEGSPLRLLQGGGEGEAMVAPIRDGDLVRGLLVAGDRLANAGPFRADHLSLFETLANHAGIAMKNRYLVQRLRGEAQRNDHQAHHDALTELPNRALFRERLEETLATSTAPCAVLLLDIDRFKEVNDTLGHHNGDRLLIEVASRLLEIVGPTGLVARLSGDEFAILVAGRDARLGTVEDQAVAVAREVGATFATPFLVEGLNLVLGVSIGISLYPDHGSTADGLIQRADVAMYHAKADRGAGFEVYRANRDEYSAARLALVSDLRTAVEGNQIEVVYQLQVAAATGAVLGAEALVRWRHPVRGLLSPLEFVGLAEHAGLIHALTERVLRLAARDAAAWRRSWPDLRVSVNISPRNLLDPALPPLVREILAEHGLPPSALTFEITESAILEHGPRVERALLDLTALGCEISIDDFGTGYSSFSYLRRLAVHELKVDRSFVCGMTTDASDRAIVELTVDLGHRLGKRVVAEGVETPEQAAHLATLGCDTLQGYLLSRPISHEAFMELVSAREASAQLPGTINHLWRPAAPATPPVISALPGVRRLDTAS